MRKGKTCAGVPRPGGGARRRLLKFPKPNDSFIIQLVFFIRLVTLRARGAFRGLRHVRRTHHRRAEAAHLAPVRPAVRGLAAPLRRLAPVASQEEVTPHRLQLRCVVALGSGLRLGRACRLLGARELRKELAQQRLRQPDLRGAELRANGVLARCCFAELAKLLKINLNRACLIAEIRRYTNVKKPS